MHYLSRLFEEKFWATLTLLTFCLVGIASIFWSINHPYGIHWDEASYINLAHKDIIFFKDQGFLGLAASIVGGDRSRPAAYRLLAIPITLIAGVDSGILRFISVLFWGISLIFVYLAAKRLAGPPAGGFATVFLGICPTIISSIMAYGTEYPLYLSIAATLHFLFLDWNCHRKASRNWIGLGLALGLGAWSKASFGVVVVPIMLLAFALSWRRVVVGPSPKFLLKAVALAIALASPWWLLNFQQSLAYIRTASSFERHSLGPPSLATWIKWLDRFAHFGIGYPLTLLTIAILL
ncbi:MAG TPA: glycosyltransferase family 39 protein, partial [Candidatus Caenarcaniphilales bacterium]